MPNDSQLPATPPGSAPCSCSAFESWITDQDDFVDWDVITPTDQMKMAWNAAVKAAAKQCKEYAHSGVNVYRRQVAYACQRRIEALVETPNDPSERIAADKPKS